MEWADADADAALIGIEDEHWRAAGRESVLRWGELAGSDPVPCAAVGFPWASARPDRIRDTAHVYGQLAPLGQLRQGRLDLDVASASPSAREGGSPWAGMSGAGVIADSHLVGVITVHLGPLPGPACRGAGELAARQPGFPGPAAAHGVQAEAAPVGGGWYLQLPGEQTVSLDPAYRPVSRRFRPPPSTLLNPEHGSVPASLAHCWLPPSLGSVPPRSVRLARRRLPRLAGVRRRARLDRTEPDSSGRGTW